VRGGGGGRRTGGGRRMELTSGTGGLDIGGEWRWNVGSDDWVCVCSTEDCGGSRAAEAGVGVGSTSEAGASAEGGVEWSGGTVGEG